MDRTISASVGDGGANRPADVRTIQEKIPTGTLITYPEDWPAKTHLRLQLDQDRDENLPENAVIGNDGGVGDAAH